MPKFRFIILLLIPFTFLQGCATAVVTSTEGAAIVPDRRTTGSIIDDQGIEFKASYALFKNKAIYDQSHINVTSYNGIILISGETLTEELKQKISDEVKVIPKVRRIHNELTIGAPSALTSRSSDTWITSKIKTKLATSSTIDPTYVKVVTENGIVYLMGILTHKEAEQAVDVVTKSAGVQRVVKIFEYID
ncbi:BON domain-containing protein [Methylophaga sp. 42_25_T18]|nr:BON domain-containing protein [Methylophaga sp. 42_25_T18]OUR87831.1 BON domain-containing protein [Methylophaga sp. 42_8_T64]